MSGTLPTRSAPTDEWVDPVEQWDHEDAPHRSEGDRYAIYEIVKKFPGSAQGSVKTTQRRLCETSLSGIGQAVLSMLQDGEVEQGARIGVFDRLTRQWLIHPYA